MFWHARGMVGCCNTNPSKNAIIGAPCLPTACSEILKSVTAVFPRRAARIVPSAMVSAERAWPSPGIDSSQMVCPWEAITSMSFSRSYPWRRQNSSTESAKTSPRRTLIWQSSSGVVLLLRMMLKTGCLMACGRGMSSYWRILRWRGAWGFSWVKWQSTQSTASIDVPELRPSTRMERGSPCCWVDIVKGSGGIPVRV